MYKAQRTSKYLYWTAASLLSVSAAQAYELKFGTNLPPVDIHGFASQGFLYSSDNNFLGDSSRGSFRFTEAGLNASMNPFARTRITAQAFLFDVGGIGEYQPFLDYASVEYVFNDHLGLRGGRIRKPGGIYNHIQDVDLARTSVLLPQGIYDARWRDLSTSVDGGSIFGNVTLGPAGSLSYEAYAGVLSISKDGGVGRVIQNGLPPAPFGHLDSIDSSTLVGDQLWWSTPVNGLRVGASFQYIFNFDYDFNAGVGPMRSESYIPIQQYSLEYVWNSWTFQAEYYNLALGTKTSMGGTQISDTYDNSDSWYVGAAYRFNKWLEVGSYYNEYYADTRDRDGDTLAFRSDAAQKDLALSFRFDPIDWLVLKVEGHYIRGTALLHDDANNPSRNSDGWFMLATKATVSF